MAELIAPELIAPELIAPELIAPELIAPELIAPELIAPELIAPELIALVEGALPADGAEVEPELGEEDVVWPVLHPASRMAVLAAAMRAVRRCIVISSVLLLMERTGIGVSTAAPDRRPKLGRTMMAVNSLLRSVNAHMRHVKQLWKPADDDARGAEKEIKS